MKQEKAVKRKKKERMICEKKERKRKKKQAEEANSPLNQKARVIKRIQGFEHQWIGGPTGIKSWPKRLDQAVPNHVLVA